MIVDQVAPRPNDAENVSRDLPPRTAPPRDDAAAAPEVEAIEVAPPVRRRGTAPLAVAGLGAVVLAVTFAPAPELPARAADPHALHAAVDDGFARLSHDPAGAEATFREVLTMDPGSVTAALGLAHAHLARRDDQGAVGWLCLAASDPGAAGADARSLLDTHGLACP